LFAIEVVVVEVKMDNDGNVVDSDVTVTSISLWEKGRRDADRGRKKKAREGGGGLITSVVGVVNDSI